MKIKDTCLDCTALAKQLNQQPGQWNAGCELGYKNEVRGAGFAYPIPVRLEDCPKPKTIKEFKVLSKPSSLPFDKEMR